MLEGLDRILSICKIHSLSTAIRPYLRHSPDNLVGVLLNRFICLVLQCHGCEWIVGIYLV